MKCVSVYIGTDGVGFYLQFLINLEIEFVVLKLNANHSLSPILHSLKLNEEYSHVSRR